MTKENPFIPEKKSVFYQILRKKICILPKSKGRKICIIILIKGITKKGKLRGPTKVPL